MRLGSKLKRTLREILLIRFITLMVNLWLLLLLIRLVPTGGFLLVPKVNYAALRTSSHEQSSLCGKSRKVDSKANSVTIYSPSQSTSFQMLHGLEPTREVSGKSISTCWDVLHFIILFFDFRVFFPQRMWQQQEVPQQRTLLSAI